MSKINKVDYINFKKALQKSMEQLFIDNTETKDEIIKSTRFEIKNKATADEVLRKIDVK